MKKITFLKLIILPLLGFGKIYDFTGSDNPVNWVKQRASNSATLSANGIVLEWRCYF